MTAVDLRKRAANERGAFISGLRHALSITEVVVQELREARARGAFGDSEFHDRISGISTAQNRITLAIEKAQAVDA